MADDPTRDDSPVTRPTGPAQPDGEIPYVPYQPPTRRQMRESEARAKAREAGEVPQSPRARRSAYVPSAGGSPVPLVEPPVTPNARATAAQVVAPRYDSRGFETPQFSVPPPGGGDGPSSSPAQTAARSMDNSEPRVDGAPTPAAEQRDVVAPAPAPAQNWSGPAQNVPGRHIPLADTGRRDPGPEPELTTVEDLFDMDPAQKWPLALEPTPTKRRRRRFVWVWVLVGILAVGAGGAAAVWFTFEDQVRSVLGWELPNDYEGSGNGESVTVAVVSGQIGSDIAKSLHDAGVTMSYDAFYDLLVSKSVQPNFMPGAYQLQKHMSAASALAVLEDPANIVTAKVVIPEGTILPNTLQRVSDGTGIPLADLQAVADNYTSLGIPADAPSAEGFFFPATYDFQPGLTAQQALQIMADRMTQSLDALGVAPADRLHVVTFAALVQKESGSVEDMYKVARVFQNRLDTDVTNRRLESDASVAYGTGRTGAINTTKAERLDASNPYNTYANPGLPIGPISAPGDDALKAVLNPAEGPWNFFVLVNGDTGETKFSVTDAEHEEAKAEWNAWLKAHPDFNVN